MAHALRSRGKVATSTVRWWMILPRTDLSRLENVIRTTWEQHRQRNYQRTRIAGEALHVGGHTPTEVIVTGRAQYGPVKGNTLADHRRKVVRVAELLGGSGGVLEATFERVEQSTQV